jgi:hypothetical protein
MEPTYKSRNAPNLHNETFTSAASQAGQPLAFVTIYHYMVHHGDNYKCFFKECILRKLPQLFDKYAAGISGLNVCKHDLKGQEYQSTEPDEILLSYLFF